MNISFLSRDAVRGVLKIEIEKADYLEKTEKSLRSFRASAQIPGFRKGMAPMGMVKKMYGKHVLVEDLNTIVGEALSKYLVDNPDIRVLGHPIPNETEQKELDLAAEEGFDFFFDLAFSPALDIDFSKDDVLPYSKIVIDDDLIDEQIDIYCERFGSYDEIDGNVSEDDVIKGQMNELDEAGQPKEDGLVVEEATVLPKYMKNSSEAGKFTGANKGDSIVFNPRKAYEGATSSDSEIASLLSMAKEEVEGLVSDFRFDINSITRYKKAEADQSLFDKVFGQGAVSDIDGFRQKIRESIEIRFAAQSDYRFVPELRSFLFKKAGEIVLADDILKRIMMAGDAKLKDEDLEKEYPSILDSLKYDLITNSIFKKHSIVIENSDIENVAFQEARYMFAQYGLPAAEEYVERFAKNMLKEESKVSHFTTIAKSEKLLKLAKENITLEIKELSVEEFNALDKPAQVSADVEDETDKETNV